MSELDDAITDLDTAARKLEACADALEATGRDASTLREEADAAEAIANTLWWGGGR